MGRAFWDRGSSGQAVAPVSLVRETLGEALADVEVMRVFLRWHLWGTGFRAPTHSGVVMLWVMLRQVELGGN